MRNRRLKTDAPSEVVKIRVNLDARTVSASIAGLDWASADIVVKGALAEAHKLLETSARLRHFRRPITYRSFDPSGNLIMKHDASGCTWGEDSPERGEPGAIVFEDTRGRKASVRVEIANERGN